jgi:hypothetical protein
MNPMVRILPEDIDEAKKYDALMIEKKGGIINQMSDHFGIYGYLGQKLFRRYLDSKHVMFMEYPYVDEDPEIHNDPYDFLVGKYKIDVKTSPHYKDKELPYLIRADKKEKDQRIDIYFMIRLDLDELCGYINGAISYKRFWTIARPQIQKVQKPWVSYFVNPSELYPAEKFIEFVTN